LLRISLYPPQRSWGRGYTGFSVSVHPSSVFCIPDIFFLLNMQIIKWNLVWLFTIMSYRSSLSFVVIDQYLTELWKFVFRILFRLILQVLKWNLVWMFTIMSYRSTLSFVVIDQYLTELWPLDLEFSWKFLFSGHFWINFADIEMKLGMIV
jgi:hypothetical protein